MQDDGGTALAGSVTGAVAGSSRDLTVFIVAGEHSGDALGGPLMAELNRQSKGRVRYLGVGGELMARHGLASQFPLGDIAVMGPVAIAKALPRLVSRVYRTVAAGVSAEPDAIVIIDAPEFTHAVAKRLRRRLPHAPIIDYVSPSVWAWRSGRARKMRRYVDHVLALLPFEPEAHRRLGGPPCSYVGHPLIERLDWLRSRDADGLAARLGLDREKPVLVVLPGSRVSEITRLLSPFGEAVDLVAARQPGLQVIVPTLDGLSEQIASQTAAWSVPTKVVTGEADKFAAFRLATAALAASGTVTLELALAGTPMAVAYRVDGVAAHLRFLVKVPSVVLANLVLGENAFPELLQEDCVPDRLAAVVLPLLRDSAERRAQRAALGRIPERMALSASSPSAAAAEIVLRHAAERRTAPRPT